MVGGECGSFERLGGDGWVGSTLCGRRRVK